jgi:hypothetical protein
MNWNPLRRRAAAWIATCAILFNALAPAMAHRIDPLAAATTGSGLCSAVDATEHGAQHKDSRHDGPSHSPAHCLLCVLHTATVGPPPASAIAPIAIGAPPAPAVVRSANPVLPRRWAAAQPRAPPAVS